MRCCAWVLSPKAMHSNGVRLSILKSRGGATGQWCMDLDAARAAAGV